MTLQSQAVIDDVRRLAEQMTPVKSIAQKLHLDESVVRHAIEHGTLPEAPPQWRSSANSTDDESGR